MENKIQELTDKIYREHRKRGKVGTSLSTQTLIKKGGHYV